jgi:hypothetical protein
MADILNFILVDDSAGNEMGKAMFDIESGEAYYYNYIGMSYSLEEGCEPYFDTMGEETDCWLIVNVIVAEEFEESDEVKEDPDLYPHSPTRNYGSGICEPDNAVERDYYDFLNTIRVNAKQSIRSFLTQLIDGY